MRALITQQQDVYKWEFLFLGANMDAVTEGARMGFQAAKSLTFEADAEGVARSFHAMSEVVACYKRMPTGSAMDDFSEVDREEANPTRRRP